MLTLLILAPLAALVLANLPFGRALRTWAHPLTLVLAIAQVGLVVFVPTESWNGPCPLEKFFTFGLAMDQIGRVMLLSIGIVVFSAMMVAGSTMAPGGPRSRFASVMLIAMVGMNGTVLLRDLFSLYVFLEITAVSSFVLIAFNKDRDALEGAFKYIILSAVATTLMVGSVALFLLVAGETSFDAVSRALLNANTSVVAKVAMGAFVCGLFIKGGLVPFHGWLPGAYSSAPAPVSVFLAGIATKVSGVYALVRLMTSVFGPGSVSLNHVLLLVGAASIVVGALAALWQDNLKRLLAYSSISQVGYIILGLGCGSPLGVLGAVFHLFNHSVFKSLLFVNSAAVEQRVGTTDMNRMGALGGRMPITSVTSLIAVLSTAGIPPLAGFWSKLVIIVALWQSHDYAYAFIAVLMSVVTLGYLLLMQRKIFFNETSEDMMGVREASFGIVVPALVLAAITIGVGVLFPWILNTFLLPIGGIL
jgi:multicomponent Na+:H+ antiporter subunit D